MFAETVLLYGTLWHMPKYDTIQYLGDLNYLTTGKIKNGSLLSVTSGNTGPEAYMLVLFYFICVSVYLIYVDNVYNENYITQKVYVS